MGQLGLDPPLLELLIRPFVLSSLQKTLFFSMYKFCNLPSPESENTHKKGENNSNQNQILKVHIVKLKISNTLLFFLFQQNIYTVDF